MRIPICEELRQLLLKSARALKARVHDGGTYVNMEGPAFSTRAESLTNHKLGYDVIGMTNLGEAKCAREAEIAYATMAMITDYDCWNEGRRPRDGGNGHRQPDEERGDRQSHRRAHDLRRFPPNPTGRATPRLQNAIMTDKKLWPVKTKKELAPILAKYL